MNYIVAQNSISESELLGKGKPKLYGTGYKLRKQAHDAFIKLQKAASKEGINVVIVSSYRSFEHQKRIWEQKYNRHKTRGYSAQKNIKTIIEYSTIPGTSRHHWGTDIDIIDANITQPKHVLHPKHFMKNGCYHKLKSWLDKHAHKYGFYIVYTQNKDRKGFKHEPWHYSYKPLSKTYLQQYKTLNLKHIFKNTTLQGAKFFDTKFINTYLLENILDINPKLL